MGLREQLQKGGLLKSAQQIAEEVSNGAAPSKPEGIRKAPTTAVLGVKPLPSKPNRKASISEKSLASDIENRPKKAISIRLDQDIIDHFKAGGDGWQSRINDELRKCSGLCAISSGS